jgi:hypothetical protein
VFRFEGLEHAMTEKPAAEDFSKSLERLKDASKRLKGKIEREKQAHDLPVDSNLGDPNWEAKAADGRFDLPEEDDD